jgi:multiple sugar transport system ATP-binding protein
VQRDIDMSRVFFDQVSKKFGNNLVVKGITLEVEDKSFVVIVGPSGCGKTTSLRMLAGLEKPTSGEIYIGDRMVNQIPPKDRDIAMVFQNYALYPHKSVYGNMAFGLVLRKTPKEQIKERVADAAGILEIGDLLERKPGQLSGGQRQRVAMGRAIVRKPQVFLFDEPLSNLDAKLRVQMRAEISKLHEKLDTTIIYVTHDQVEAMTLADKIVIMHEGIIVQKGEPLEIYDHPIDQFVAGFIGSPSMNFTKATLTAENRKIFLMGEGFRIPVPEKYQSCYWGYVGKKVVFGLRPEHIEERVTPENEPGKEPVEATIDVIEPMGSESIVFYNVFKESFIAKIYSKVVPKSRGTRTLLFNMNEMHLFDEETGKTISKKEAYTGRTE